ncbi:MAG: T9SS type A sorting domain-containing protein, partial [Candidatus Stahlbacteria bacterium]|nr:T9SS type A sorting domain-containing protein [Candidatus Stahlbacteria bacterium]
EAQEIVKGGEKANIELQIYVGKVEYYTPAPPVMCSTIIVHTTKPFDEHTLTWNNKPPLGESLAVLKKLDPYGWYSFSSARLESYVLNLGEDTIPFGLEILDRHGGICDLAWYLTTKEGGPAPKLVNGGNTYSAIGDAWVTDGPPGTPNTNYGSDPEMYVCSCTLTTHSGTQIVYVEFYIPPAGVEEEGSSCVKANYTIQNFPNPFVEGTKISFTLPVKASILLEVYDITGRLVKGLAKGDYAAGEHTVEWQAEGVRKGIYFCKLSTGSYTLIRKMILIRR